MRKILSLALIFFLVFGHTSLAASEKSQQQKPDVRLLIDISGSMKENDPNNLRIPALQLVTNLMPQNAEAGVWAFGRYVNMMVPLAPVDSKWQNRATETAKQIKSTGLYTNIGGVLKKASYGWTTPNASEKRSMILLTDGMVDISKDPKVNSNERKKILNEILPRLMRAGVTVHTIALSQNADHELLKALSTKTDGWYQAVDSAEQLQKVFLKIFEQSAARDSLPLEGNKFKVDASIEEMTLLVFKKNPLDKVKLIDPDKAIVDSATADGKVRWFSTAGYDLITVKTPKLGGWRIDADIDPDNRVMVVSKLSLNVSEVPNNLLAGEAINYHVSLLEEGALITKSDFLNLVEARLIQERAGQTNRLAMFYDTTQHQFKQSFFTENEEGVLSLTLEIKSPTFERTRNHAINIYGSPLEHYIDLSTKDDVPHTLRFEVRKDIIKPDSLVVTAKITYPDLEKQYLGLNDLTKPLSVKVFPEGGDYSVQLDIKGESILGRKFSISPSPILFSALPTESYLASQAANELAEKKTEPVDENKASVGAKVEETPLVEDTKVAEPIEEPIEDPVEELAEDSVEALEEPLEEPTDWSFWLLVGLGVNILLGGIAVFVWKKLKSRESSVTMQITDELFTDDGSENDDRTTESEQDDKEE